MPDGIAISCPKRTLSRYGVKLRRESTSHGITLSRRDVLEASHTRRASPLLAGYSLGSLPARAIRLPDKEFRYLRTFIVTAAVYRGLGSRLRPKLTTLLDLPAPGRRQPLYVVFRLRRDLCFW